MLVTQWLILCIIRPNQKIYNRQEIARLCLIFHNWASWLSKTMSSITTTINCMARQEVRDCRPEPPAIYLNEYSAGWNYHAWYGAKQKWNEIYIRYKFISIFKPSFYPASFPCFCTHAHEAKDYVDRFHMDIRRLYLSIYIQKYFIHQI